MSRPDRIVLGVGAGLLVLHLAAMELLRKPDGRVVFGDATHHFVQLRSMVFDRDLHFQNEYTRIYGLRGGEPGTEWVTTEHTVTGHVRNYMPVGPALLWMPLYLIVAAGQWALSALGLTGVPDGFDRALQLVPGVTGVLSTIAAALLCLRLARTRTDETTALVSVLAVWLGSHAIYYSLVSPSYSHAASMLATSAFFYRWITTRDAPSIGRLAGWGALAGLAALMRWQDALLVGIPLMEALRWRASVVARLGGGLAAIAAAALVFAPQMAIWTVLYGQPLAIPQGASFMRWTSPHPVAVLLSDNHGLFTWAPILIPATLGLLTIVRRERALALPLVAVVVAAWYTNAAVADWWAGEAFGARRFLSLFPLFVLGTARWLGGREASAGRSWRHGALVVLTGLNLLLLLQYQLFMKGLVLLSPYPQFWADMFLTRFVVPFRLLQWMWS